MVNIASPTYSFVDNDLLVIEADRTAQFKRLSDGYVLRVRDMPDREKPREKLVELGPSQLSAQELVAIILEVGSKKEDVLAMAERILKDYGQKAMINETDPRKLSVALDIPLTKACRVIASLELGRRFYQQKSGRQIYVRNASQAYGYLRDMGQLKKEQFRGLYLNSRYQVIRDEVISIGSLTANIVHPREVFQPAIEHGAVAVIIAHNHPSGSLESSFADRQVTTQLLEAGKTLGIDLLDHLIITGRTYKSIIKETT